MLLPDHAKEIKEKPIFDAILTLCPPNLGLDPSRSENPRTQISYGLRNVASIYQKAIRSIFSSMLEENLDCLLNLGDEDATTGRGAPIFDNYSNSEEEAKTFSDDHLDLVITSTPQGRLVFWRGFEPIELLDNSRLVAYIPDLHYQQGKLLSPISEEGSGI